MGRVIISGGSRATIPYVGPKASLTPASGVTYTDGLAGLGPAEISSYAQAISNVTGVTNDTTVMYIDYGDVHRKISIGNQVTIGVNNVNYTFDVIGFNHDDLTDSNAYGKATATGKAGMTLQMHDLFATGYQMNDSNTNSGGWKSSDMYIYTMSRMKGYLPTAWQTAIKSVNKASGLGGGSSSGTETVHNNCFLLAEIEIFGSITYSVSGEGTQYAYYKAGNSKMKNKDNSAFMWWERSPYYGDNNSFCFVTTYNSSDYNNATGYYGVAFAFCI
nr:MAG TPA: hypothetical protein [Caudoviricetes sp.]